MESSCKSILTAVFSKTTYHAVVTPLSGLTWQLSIIVNVEGFAYFSFAPPFGRLYYNFPSLQAKLYVLFYFSSIDSEEGLNKLFSGNRMLSFQKH